jgi:nucleotide-binding universal stress UspA family protein
MLRFLVTIDGSAESRSVLPLFSRLAREAQAEVTLLTVVESAGAMPASPSGVTVVTPGGSSVMAPTMLTEAVLQPPERKWAESRDQAIERAESEGLELLEDCRHELGELKPALKVLMSHDPARAIVDYVREQGFDMIAMATHGRSGLREVVQGSVAAAVLKMSHVPVLMVRPGDRS